jgi:hypothetical protein
MKEEGLQPEPLFKDMLTQSNGIKYKPLNQGRVFVHIDASIHQMVGRRQWSIHPCTCGGRACRFCATCGKEQLPAQTRA